MRVLSWNMQHLSASWDWLWLHGREFADVALLQEAAQPAQVPEWARVHPGGAASSPWHVGDPSTAPGRRWTSAVVALDDGRSFEPVPAVPLHEAKDSADHVISHPGQWAAAEVDGVRLVSLYGIWDRFGGMGEADAVPSLHRALSDLTPLISSSRQRAVVAGDLNLWHGHGDWRDHYMTVFDRLAADGFVFAGPFSDEPAADCACASAGCRHAATFRRGEARRWQTDFVHHKGFGKSPLPVTLVSDTWEISDHCALVIDVA